MLHLASISTHKVLEVPEKVAPPSGLGVGVRVGGFGAA